MIRAAIRGIWEHKLRTLLLVLSIVAGVSFVAGSLIFTDTIGGSFEAIFDGAFEGIDIQVTPDVDQGFSSVQPAFDASVRDLVEETPGVQETWPVVAGLMVVGTLLVLVRFIFHRRRTGISAGAAQHRHFMGGGPDLRDT